MSYLYLEDGIPNFSKAVINLWFRVPKFSLEALADRAWEEQEAENNGGHATDGSGNPLYIKRRLHKWLPLVVWGPLQDGYQIDQENHVDETGYTRHNAVFNGCAGWIMNPDADESFPYFTGTTYTQGQAVPLRPSGLYVEAGWGRDDDGNRTDELSASFEVRIQMDDNGSGKWIRQREEISMSDYYRVASAAEPGCAPPSMHVKLFNTGELCQYQAIFPTESTLENHYEFIDETELWTQRNGPEVYSSQSFPVEPDKWNHVLVSFDLRNRCEGKGRLRILDYEDCPSNSQLPVVLSDEDVRKITGGGKMWLSWNGTNVDDPGLHTNRTTKNTIVTDNVDEAASVSITEIKHHIRAMSDFDIETFTQSVEALSVPTFAYTPSPIPSDGEALGLPGTPDLVDDILRVEMAEFQMFTGVTLDTSKKANREAFISDKGKPVNPKKAAELLEVEPIISLHGSTKWITGENSGSQSNPEPGTPEFKTEGLIRKYLPDPNLFGRQGETS